MISNLSSRHYATIKSAHDCVHTASRSQHGSYNYLRGQFQNCSLKYCAFVSQDAAYCVYALTFIQHYIIYLNLMLLFEIFNSQLSICYELVNLIKVSY